jgi:hypothetical protein
VNRRRAWGGQSALLLAGADVLYAPNLPERASISAVVRAVALKPVNVLVSSQDGPPSRNSRRSVSAGQPWGRPLHARPRGYTGGGGEACEGKPDGTRINLNFGHIIDLIKG